MNTIYRHGPLAVTLDAFTGRIFACVCLIDGVLPSHFRCEYINEACIKARAQWEATIDR